MSACEVSMEADTRNANCEQRPPDLTDAPPGDSFEDQMMGISVLATENGQKVQSLLFLAFSLMPF